MTRYTFDEVRDALKKEWDLSLYRGGEMGGDGRHDGRWDTCYSKTGFVMGGDFPGIVHSYRRFPSLVAVVRTSKLGEVIASARRKRA